MVALAPGTPVGRYVVEGLLGSGGMGVVYSARDPRLERTVALKVMAEHLADDPDFRERFLREAAVLGRLDSPHIVTVLDQGEDDGRLWIATTRIEGGDLGRQIAARGPLPPALAADVVAQVADGLDDAHRAGVLHRDVKPANVLLAAGTGGFHAVLTDFGVAQDTSGQTTVTGGAAGTWGYLAPERGHGRPATPASDVYSAGCLLVACVTGQPPFTGTDPEVALAHARTAPPHLPGRDPVSRQLDAVAQRALSKDPAQRHRIAGELAADLAGIAAGTGPVHTAVPRRRTGRVVVAVVGACAVVAAIGGVAAWQLSGDDDPDPKESSSAEGGSSDPTDAPAEPVDRPITSDFDDDGYGDIPLTDISTSDYPTTIAKSTGDRFSEPEQYANGASFMFRGDFDGDGTAGLVTIAQVESKYRIQIVSGGVDSQQVPVPKGSTVYNPTVGDYDGDGHDDLALTSDTAVEDRFTVWVSLYDGEDFGPFEQWYDADRSTEGPVAGDFDGDGDSDLVVLDTGGIELLESDGSGFTSHDRQSATNSPGSWFRAAAADLDGDGTDELVSIASPTVSVWRYADDAWDDETWLSADADDGLGSTPVIGDFDGDRRDDVAVVRGGVDVEDLELLVMLSDGTQLQAPQSWLVRKCGCRDETTVVRQTTS